MPRSLSTGRAALPPAGRRTRTTTEYAELLATVQGLGLLGRRCGYYAVMGTLLAVALVAVIGGAGCWVSIRRSWRSPPAWPWYSPRSSS